MPHVVIRGNICPRELWEAFEKMEMRHGGDVRKIDRAFLDRQESLVLFSALAISGGFRQRFLIQIAKKDDEGVTLRLEPMTDPEKTDAVRFTLAVMAHWVLQMKPDLEVCETNLSEFLDQAAATLKDR